MTATEPVWTSDTDAVAEAILSRVGKDLRVGLPLGLGKANSLINALYARAEQDRSIRLRIFTALTLSRPQGSHELECRFLEPLFERLAGSYPELAYNAPLQSGSMPPNISVQEFYFPAGRRLGADLAQQCYTAANFTHVARDLLNNRINVIAQLVARRETGGETQLSLGCDPDVTIDLLPELKRRREGGEPIAIAAQVNEQLPFMLGAAVLDPSEFDLILDGPGSQFDLFAVPRRPVSLGDYAAAFHIASQIPDGGTVQIGIGGFADALTHVLKLRHVENARFRALASKLEIEGGGAFMDPFETGLYACSEMLVEGLIELKRVGVLKRRAWENRMLDGVNPVIHSAFFLGSRTLYERLRALSEEERADIWMGPVSYVNQLYGNEEMKRLSRTKARFINKAMIATGLGAVVSDALETGEVVSGVGGQFNFVVQAHELEDARAILVIDATREVRGRTLSNIVWRYGHTTIPRHLKDMVITEYGIADLRGKCDRDVMVEMLGITDARFQDTLLAEAKRAGKIERGYGVPDAFRRNTPERLDAALGAARRDGVLPDYPLGTDMTPAEIRLVPALRAIRSIAHSKARIFGLMLKGMRQKALTVDEAACLQRLDLHKPEGLRETLTRWLVSGALAETSGR